MIPWMLIGAHARRGRLRTLLTVGSVAIAMFLYCGLRTVITTIESTVSQAESGRLVVQNSVSLFGSLPISMERKLHDHTGVDAVTHWTWIGGHYQDPKNFFAKFAVDPVTLREAYGDKRKGDRKATIKMPPEQWEAFLADRTGCIVGINLQRDFRFRDEQTGEPTFVPGFVMPIIGTIYPGDYRFTIRGVYRSDSPAFDENTMFCHWDYVDETVGRRGTVSTFVLDLGKDADPAAVATAVDEEFRNSGSRSRTLTEQAFNKQFQSMWGGLPTFLAAIGGAILFAALMVTLNTLLLNARERVTEVGVLKTLGFPDGSVGALLLTEGVVLCTLGAMAGAGGAVLVFNTFLGEFVQMFLPGFRVLDSTVGEAVGVGLLLGLVTGMVPSLLVARIPIVRALRRIG